MKRMYSLKNQKKAVLFTETTSKLTQFYQAFWINEIELDEYMHPKIIISIGTKVFITPTQIKLKAQYKGHLKSIPKEPILIYPFLEHNSSLIIVNCFKRRLQYSNEFEFQKDWTELS